MGANCTSIYNNNHDGNNQHKQQKIRKKRHEKQQEQQLIEQLRSVDSGQRQSPINIDTAIVHLNSELNDLKRTKCLNIVYPKLMSNLIIQNTGYGWKLDIPEMIAAKTGKYIFVIEFIFD